MAAHDTVSTGRCGSARASASRDAMRVEENREIEAVAKMSAHGRVSCQGGVAAQEHQQEGCHASRGKQRIEAAERGAAQQQQNVFREGGSARASASRGAMQVEENGRSRQSIRTKYIRGSTLECQPHLAVVADVKVGEVCAIQVLYSTSKPIWTHQFFTLAGHVMHMNTAVQAKFVA